ncbi:MAG: hypothetical protein V4696_10245 [Pseudomonadota bacterium]
MSEIDALKAKLKARYGRPGFNANALAIEATIARMEGNPFTFREIKSGEFVTTEYALANPDTTRRVENA